MALRTYYWCELSDVVSGGRETPEGVLIFSAGHGKDLQLILEREDTLVGEVHRTGVDDAASRQGDQSMGLRGERNRHSIYKVTNSSIYITHSRKSFQHNYMHTKNST